MPKIICAEGLDDSVRRLVIRCDCGELFAEDWLTAGDTVECPRCGKRWRLDIRIVLEEEGGGEPCPR